MAFFSSLCVHHVAEMLHWEVCGRWNTSIATILHCSIPLLWYADMAENVQRGYFLSFFSGSCVPSLEKPAIFLESQAITVSQNRVVFLRKLQPCEITERGKQQHCEYVEISPIKKQSMSQCVHESWKKYVISIEIFKPE